MTDLWTALSLVLRLLSAPPVPTCPPPRTCAVWTGQRFDCMRRHRGGPCAPWRKPWSRT